MSASTLQPHKPMGAFQSKRPSSVIDACDTFDQLPSEPLHDGTAFDFASTRGGVVLVVNVASYCGLTTKNYEDFKLLQDRFGDDLTILAFPCNGFMFQEPFGAKSACAFARKRGFKGMVFQKVKVNGSGASETFKWLKSRAGVRRIGWNFGKFLIDRDGKVRGYYSPQTRPRVFEGDVEALIGEKATEALA